MSAWRCLLILACLAAAPALALEPATTGVVVLHGKWGNTGVAEDFVTELREAGFSVERPEMPWSGRRLFDRSFDQAIEEIEAAAGRLRGKGATRIVIAGHSLGGDGALGYAAKGKPVAALVLFAPAHFPEGTYLRDRAGDSIAKAQEMVAAGRGEDTASFTSVNDGNRTRPIQAKARDYLSYYGPDADAAMSRQAPSVGEVPILWLAGTLDSTTQTFAKLVRPSFPPSARLDQIEVVAGHMDVPQVGRRQAVEWLKALP